MKLSELIAQVGDENVQFQTLSDCITNITKGKKGPAKVTFGTSMITMEDVLTNFKDKCCLIVVMPRDKMPK